MTNNDEGALLSAYVDGEVTQQEAQRVEMRLRRDPEFRRQKEQIEELRRASQLLRQDVSEEVDMDRLWQRIEGRLGRRLGGVLAGTGLVGLIVYGVYRVFADGNVSWVPKTFLGLLLVGGIMLLVSVVREAREDPTRDKYGRVER